MKRFGEFLQAVGIIGALLFMSGADLNEITVTICGILANCRSRLCEDQKKEARERI